MVETPAGMCLKASVISSRALAYASDFSNAFERRYSGDLPSWLILHHCGYLVLHVATKAGPIFAIYLFQLLLSMCCILLLYSPYYIFCAFIEWKKHFSNRVGRGNANCPSNKDIPKSIPLRYGLLSTNRYAKDHNVLAAKKHFPATNIIQQDFSRKRSARTPSLVSNSSASLSRKKSFSASLKAPGSLDKENAMQLDMDHVYVPFSSYLWAQYFIAPNVGMIAFYNLSKLWIRATLAKSGFGSRLLSIRTHPRCDPAEIVGKLLLEQSLAIYYECTWTGRSGEKLARFLFSSIPIIDNKGRFKEMKELKVDINLPKKRLVTATLDGNVLSAEQAMILLYFNLIFTTHVKIHSLANWAVNCEPEQMVNNPFHARNSVATVMYNHFGYTGFFRLLPLFVRIGLLRIDIAEALTSVFDDGISSGIVSHPHIHNLTTHSRFVNFLIKVHRIFMKEFAKHKAKEFPGVQGEALFTGTVLHSLDHLYAELAIEDELWLDINDARFGVMAQICRIVRAGFVSDLPCLTFHKSFKNSGHPFYEAVYEKAAKIDKYLADNMDTCIIK